MTDYTPKEPGFYWARAKDEPRYEPVEVIDWCDHSLWVYSFAYDQDRRIEDFIWGPRITLPTELEEAL